MKIMKNKFFKIASLMIMLCLISTCAIGTTFAKYVTSDTATDSARVAKWGVRLTMQGDDLFDNQYATDSNAYAGSLSVDASSDVVAPGTSGSTTFTITGSPEVAVNVQIAFSGYDIVLPAGTILNNGPDGIANTTDDIVLVDDYLPVVFTLTQTKGYNDLAPQTPWSRTGSLEFIQGEIDNFTQNYDPNTVLNAEFELSWEWDFNGNDDADTMLGDLMAEKIEAEAEGRQYTLPAGVSLETGYTIAVTVTQID